MVEHFRPGSAGTACTTVEISVSCRNLADMDTFSKSDPMCVLFVKESGNDDWYEYGRTEMIKNNLNPDFVKKFLINFFFEERQRLKFEIYDVDANSYDLSRHDFIGRVEMSLGEIVSSGRLERNLEGGTRSFTGTIIIAAASESAGCKEEITFTLQGRRLDKKSCFCKSDPFLTIYKMNADNTSTVVHRTEVIKRTLNPIWSPITLSSLTLCGGDYNRPIGIKCFDWSCDGTEDLIGGCMTTLHAMVQVAQGHAVIFALINPLRKAKTRGYKCSGSLILTSIQIRPILTFLDYIQAGTQLNCTIAIDFTASNGDPSDPSSLHYIHPLIPNQYQCALMAVGEIIQDYDTDKLFPVLGFGARFPPMQEASHEFFVNGHPTDPFCNGIQGVIAAYQKCLLSVQLYGPTNFSNVINHVARFAAAKRDGSEYFILLIITDGAITDMAQTKEAIVNAAVLPLSIIIVGVGDDDFEAMRELDGDVVPLSSRGRLAERDIVQFVPFRNFVNPDPDPSYKSKSSSRERIRGGGPPINMNVAKARLAREVLAEIPAQFLSYMKRHDIFPGSWTGARPIPTPKFVGPPLAPVRFPGPPSAVVPPLPDPLQPLASSSSKQAPPRPPFIIGPIRPLAGSSTSIRPPLTKSATGR